MAVWPFWSGFGLLFYIPLGSRGLFKVFSCWFPVVLFFAVISLLAPCCSGSASYFGFHWVFPKVSAGLLCVYISLSFCLTFLVVFLWLHIWRVYGLPYGNLNCFSSFIVPVPALWFLLVFVWLMWLMGGADGRSPLASRWALVCGGLCSTGRQFANRFPIRYTSEVLKSFKK